MRINPELCTGCRLCLPYCPGRAIGMADGKARVAQDRCIECRTCQRSEVCPVDAFVRPPLGWPRIVRAFFSDANFQAENREALAPYKDLLGGMKLEEVKMADVTGRCRPGIVGIGIEMGRPAIATSFREVQRMTRLVAKLGGVFENNSVTRLMRDTATGDLRSDILDEVAFSVIIGFTVPMERLEEVVKAVIAEGGELATVFSLDVIAGVENDGNIPACVILRRAGVDYRPNAKINVGMSGPDAV